MFKLSPHTNFQMFDWVNILVSIQHSYITPVSSHMVNEAVYIVVSLSCFSYIVTCLILVSGLLEGKQLVIPGFIRTSTSMPPTTGCHQSWWRENCPLRNLISTASASSCGNCTPVGQQTEIVMWELYTGRPADWDSDVLLLSRPTCRMECRKSSRSWS